MDWVRVAVLVAAAGALFHLLRWTGAYDRTDLLLAAGCGAAVAWVLL